MKTGNELYGEMLALARKAAREQQQIAAIDAAVERAELAEGVLREIGTLFASGHTEVCRTDQARLTRIADILARAKGGSNDENE